MRIKARIVNAVLRDLHLANVMDRATSEGMTNLALPEPLERVAEATSCDATEFESR